MGAHAEIEAISAEISELSRTLQSLMARRRELGYEDGVTRRRAREEVRREQREQEAARLRMVRNATPILDWDVNELAISTRLSNILRFIGRRIVLRDIRDEAFLAEVKASFGAGRRVAKEIDELAFLVGCIPEGLRIGDRECSTIQDVLSGLELHPDKPAV